MTRAVVIHYSLNLCGGGERVCLYTIQVLNELGVDVDLITGEKTLWYKVQRLIDVPVKISREIVVSRKLVQKFSIYNKLWTSYRVLSICRKYDLTVNTSHETLLVPADVVYVHFPHIIFLKDTYEYWHSLSKYYSSALWRMYFEPYRLGMEALSESVKNSILIANSTYTAEKVRKYIRSKVFIIHPPVQVEKYIKLSENEDRKDVVITIARYTREKNLELIPVVASRCRDLTFIIAGSVHSEDSMKILRKLLYMREKLNLKNLKLLVNVPENLKIRLLSIAKLYLHPMIGEHFGIAVVEAMASGLVPIVHKSGGTWIDILEYGKYGLGYETVDECVEAIYRALERYHTLRKLCIARSLEFSERRFMQRMKVIIGKLL